MSLRRGNQERVGCVILLYSLHSLFSLAFPKETNKETCNCFVRVKVRGEAGLVPRPIAHLRTLNVARVMALRSRSLAAVRHTGVLNRASSTLLGRSYAAPAESLQQDSRQLEKRHGLPTYLLNVPPTQVPALPFLLASLVIQLYNYFGYNPKFAYSARLIIYLFIYL